MTFTEILSEYGIEHRKEGHHHCTPGWIQFDCPFCSLGSGKFRAGFNINGRFVNCWVCGPHPTVLTLKELTDLPAGKIHQLVDGIDEFEPRVNEKTAGKLEIPSGAGILTKHHREYLIRRGFDPEQIVRLWGIQGFKQVGNRYSWRLFIPIHFQGEVVSWTTRAIGDRGPKYLSAPPRMESVHYKNILYGEDYCRNAIIIHEGPTDVWRTGPGAVCTFGVGYTVYQVTRMVKYPVRVVCFDNEPDAQRRARELCAKLSAFSGQTHLVTLSSDDPADATDDEVLQLRGRFLD